MARLTNNTLALVIGISLALISSSLCVADTIHIEFTGVDIAYNGTDITDADPALNDPDPLSTVVLSVDDVTTGPILTSDITHDLLIPGVAGIPVTGGHVTSAGGGTLDIGLGTGNYLNMNLATVDVNFINIIPGAVTFAFAGSVASVTGQSLPSGLEIGSDVTVSISSQVDPASLTDDGAGIVTGFTSAGTGEVGGIAVPEPTSIALLLLAIAGTCSLTGRQK